MENISELLERCKENMTVFDAVAKAHDVINSAKYKNIMCSISGGSDSDIMLDLLYRIDYQKKITYVWFDTGLEYKATKDHLKYLEDKYKIIIHRERAVQPIPTTCRTIGQPFISKQVSEMIERLQAHGFKFEDKPYDELVKEYEGCSVAIKWWCNEWGNIQGKKSRFDISRNKYLKEFMVKNPPTFKIANKCCKFAKKDVAKKYIKDHEIDLNITGVRRLEGGARSTAYKTCFSAGKGVDNFRPLFWFSNSDKEYYESVFGVVHSKCYTEYGLARTGCAGCPYNRKFEEELKVIHDNEPNLYVGVNNIFAYSYEYTRRYRDFCKKINKK